MESERSDRLFYPKALLYFFQAFSVLASLFFASHIDIFEGAAKELILEQKMVQNSNLSDQRNNQSRQLTLENINSREPLFIENSSYICCYVDPNNGDNIGRPFLETEFTDFLYRPYVEGDNTMGLWGKIFHPERNSRSGIIKISLLSMLFSRRIRKYL